MSCLFLDKNDLNLGTRNWESKKVPNSLSTPNMPYNNFSEGKKCTSHRKIRSQPTTMCRSNVGQGFKS